MQLGNRLLLYPLFSVQFYSLDVEENIRADPFKLEV